MVQDAMDICLRVLKKSYKSSFDSYTSGTVYRLYPILPFGIVACTVFPTTFLEIAVYIELDHRDWLQEDEVFERQKLVAGIAEE